MLLTGEGQKPMWLHVLWFARIFAHLPLWMPVLTITSPSLVVAPHLVLVPGTWGAGNVTPVVVGTYSKTCADIYLVIPLAFGRLDFTLSLHSTVGAFGISGVRHIAHVFFSLWKGDVPLPSNMLYSSRQRSLGPFIRHTIDARR